jgi:hypothetical protein
VVAMEADESEVTRSRLADGEIWRQRGEKLSLLAVKTGEQEVTRSR